MRMRGGREASWELYEYIKIAITEKSQYRQIFISFYKL